MLYFLIIYSYILYRYICIFLGWFLADIIFHKFKNIIKKSVYISGYISNILNN